MKIIDAIKNNKKENLVISLAKYPGKFGMKVHNSMLKHYNMDYEYISCSTDNLEESINQIKKYNIIGCSVSMPYKIEIMKLLDEIDESAQSVGAVNTIINKKGKLIGYNTDIDGAKWAVDYAEGKIALLGNGGMSKSFQYALAKKDYHIITRNNWDLLQKYTFDTIINATPIGMLDDSSPVITYEHKIAIDSVVKMTTFVKESFSSINGIDISLRQAYKQFQLYFNKEPILQIMKNSVKELYDN